MDSILGHCDNSEGVKIFKAIYLFHNHVSKYVLIKGVISKTSAEAGTLGGSFELHGRFTLTGQNVVISYHF